GAGPGKRLRSLRPGWAGDAGPRRADGATRGQRGVPLRAEPDVPGRALGHRGPGAAARADAAVQIRGAHRARVCPLRPLLRGAGPPPAVRGRVRGLLPSRTGMVASAAPVAGVIHVATPRGAPPSPHTPLVPL